MSKPTKDLGLREEVPYPNLVAGGPPFPAYPNDEQKYGLTILDWFAGHVAAGLAANVNVIDQAKSRPCCHSLCSFGW